MNVQTMRWFWCTTCLLGLLLWTPTARAGVDFEGYVEVPLNQGIGVPLDQGNGPLHGILYLQYTNRKNVGTGNQLRLGLNTDTVWVAWDIGATSGQPFVFTPYIKGQFGFGEMTPDYIRGGQYIKELSFLTLYGEAGIDTQYRLPHGYRFEASVAFRYWWFAHFGPSEQAGFILPQHSPAIQAQIGIVTDTINRSLEGGRLEEGVRIAVYGRLRHRFINQPWGGQQTTFVDLRNSSPSPYPTFQLLADATWSQRIQRQIVLSLGFEGGTGWFADDLHRFKVGGDNTFLPMISGTYLAEFAVDSYAIGRAKMMFLPLRWLRITPQVDVGFLSNIQRANPRAPEAQVPGVVLGLGLALDFFIKDYMRIHVKLSMSPNVPRPQQHGGWKIFAGYAASWW